MTKKVFTVKSIIKALDLFGISYNFTMDNEYIFKTFSGGLISIFFYFITIGLFFGFGVDFYERNNPKVAFNSKITDYEKYFLSNDNFTLAFRVEDYNGIQILNESIIYHKVGFFNFEIDKSSGKWVSIKKEIDQSLTYKKCNELQNHKEKEKFYNISLNSWYCVNFNNFTFGGYWDGNFNYGIIINTLQCSKKLDKDKNCLDEKLLKSNFYDNNTGSNYFYSFLYMESLPLMDNYLNPIQNNLVNKYEMLNLKIQKRSIQIFKKVSIINDEGWLFSNRKIEWYFSSDTIMADFNLKEEFDQNILYSHLLYLGKKNDIYSRTYTKVQEVFASVGGFTKIFLTILGLLHSTLARILKNFLLIERIEFFFDIKDYSEKLSNTHKFNNSNHKFSNTSSKSRKNANRKIETTNDNNLVSLFDIIKNNKSAMFVKNQKDKVKKIIENNKVFPTKILKEEKEMTNNFKKINDDCNKISDNYEQNKKIKNECKELVQKNNNPHEKKSKMMTKICLGDEIYNINDKIFDGKKIQNENINNYIYDIENKYDNYKSSNNSLSNNDEKIEKEKIYKHNFKINENISILENSSSKLHEIFKKNTNSNNKKGILYNNRKGTENFSNPIIRPCNYQNRFLRLSLLDFIIERICCKKKQNVKENFKFWANINDSFYEKKGDEEKIYKINKKDLNLEKNKIKIYYNYESYRDSLERKFDVFNYINLIKDVTYIKYILLNENQVLLDFLKPKLDCFENNVKNNYITSNSIDNIALMASDKKNNFLIKNLSILLKKQFFKSIDDIID